MDTRQDLEGHLGYGENVRADLLDAVVQGMPGLSRYALADGVANPPLDYLLEVLEDAEREVADYGVDAPEVDAAIEVLRAELLAPAQLPFAA